MSKETNGLQKMVAQVSDGYAGGCAEGVTVTEFSAAVTPAASRDVGSGARDRALAGLSI